MSMTFRELKAILDKMPKERLDDHVSIMDTSDEFHEISQVKIAREETGKAAGILDKGHRYLVIAK